MQTAFLGLPVLNGHCFKADSHHSLMIVGQNRRSENRRLPEWPIAKTADASLGPPEINLPIPLIQ